MIGPEAVKSLLLVVAFSLALVFTYKTLVERDLIKAIIYSAGQAVAYGLALIVLMAPDLALAYMAVGVGIYSALFLLVASKTERYEEVGSSEGK